MLCQLKQAASKDMLMGNSRQFIKMPTKEDLELLEQAPMTQLMISGLDMLCLLGVIQLALRHPGNNGPSSQVAQVFAEELEKRIVAASPGFKELCAAGWNSKYDVPV